MLLTGYLVGVLRAWREELGGYDITMHGLGQNMETALRVWLCGDEIIWMKGNRKGLSSPLAYHLVIDSSRFAGGIQTPWE